MKRNSSQSFTVGSILSIVLACTVFVALIATRFSTDPAMLQLHFNAYAIISIVAASTTLLILLQIIIRNSHTEETGWFLLVLLGQILFAGSEAMQRCSLDKGSAVFWSQMGGAGVSILGTGLFLFAVAYAKPARARPAILGPLLLWVTTIVTVYYSEGNLFFNNNPSQIKSYPWGYNNDPGSAFVLALIWAVLPGLIAGVILLLFRRSTDNPLLRKQSLLFAIAISIPLIMAGITDGVLPALHIESIPPLATMFEVVTCLIISYGTSKYQFFQVNQAALAENVLSSMNEAVVVTQADFSIEYINNEAERLLKRTTAELRHVKIDTLFTPDSWTKINGFIQGTSNVIGVNGFDDIAVIDQTGAETPVRAVVTGLQEGKYQAHVFVISDITDIVDSYHKLESDANQIRTLLEDAKRLENQLETEKNSISQIVDLRTNELRRAQTELKESDRLKTEFIMLGSHNLRTPITIMASSLEVLKQTQDEARRQELFNSLGQGIDRLKDFVEDMVSIVSLESGSGLEHAPTTIASLLAPVVADANALATTKPDITFSADIRDQEAILNANTVRLQGALSNIVSNAFKFTQSGRIEIVGHRINNSYGIIFSDTGIGIAADELPRIFTMFHRGTDTLQYEYEGKGIGLYLTKLIIDEHGGTIQVQSTPGSGSTFTVSLPL